MQLILSGDGHLISHPELRDRIAAAEGQLKLASLKDPLLEQIHRMVSQAAKEQGGTQWVAWSRIQGPNWYQIHLMPQYQVQGPVLWGLSALCAVGLLGLLPVLWAMRGMINTLVARPLQRLTEAVDMLGHGKTPPPIALGTEDELGRPALAFDGMVAELVQKRGQEVAHARALPTDVDERRQYMVSLEEERARLLALLGAMDLGILFVTADNKVKYCNSTFLSIWRIPRDEKFFVGRPAQAIFDAAGQGRPYELALWRHIRNVLATPQESSRYEVDVDGEQFLRLISHPVRDSENRYIGRLWIHEDVTREQQTAAQLVYLAERDALTGLSNRRCFEEELQRFFRDQERSARPGALLFFDRDEFEFLNDTFGHGAGDPVLVGGRRGAGAGP